MSGNYVSREGNCIFVEGKLNLQSFLWVVARLREAEQKGYRDFIFDFTACDIAFPEGLVPMAALAHSLRNGGTEIEVVLPNHDVAERLLVNCNLAHFIRPDLYEYKQVILPKHVSIRRFTSTGEQVAVVKEFINIALNNLKLPRDVLQGMEWSLNEIMDNVLIHSQAGYGGFVGAMTLEDQMTFCVADCGRGILTSLKEGYPALTRDIDAIGEAVKAGVTRNPDIGQGNGLAGSLRIATGSGGSITIASGAGLLNVYKHSQNTESHGSVLPPFQRFSGTIVSAQIRKSATFSMSEALGFTNMIGGVLDTIETDYESEDGRAFLVSMKKESPGFGSRDAGKQVRTKLLNLLEADKTKILVLNWDGVPLISSSFADEALAKLFVELGPIEFSGRVRNVAVPSLVRRLIDKAILQRSAQAVTAANNRASAQHLDIKITDAPHLD